LSYVSPTEMSQQNETMPKWTVECGRVTKQASFSEAVNKETVVIIKDLRLTWPGEGLHRGDLELV
jgi:hypothetical protein